MQTENNESTASVPPVPAQASEPEPAQEAPVVAAQLETPAATTDVEMQSQQQSAEPKMDAAEVVRDGGTTKEAITAENMPTAGVMLTSDYAHLQQMYQA